MSRSTLPDIFKADLNTIKFHPAQKPKKVGGRFSIKLSTNDKLIQSPQKSVNKLKKLQSSNGFTKSIYEGTSTKIRSQSINMLPSSLKQQSSIRNSLFKQRKSVAFNQPNYYTHKHTQSTLTKQATLQQIHYNNIIHNKFQQQKIHAYGFPYQTTRSMNNMKIQMEEADSFKNRVQNIQKEQQQCSKIFKQIQKQTFFIKQTLIHFRQQFLEDLQLFHQDFTYMCQDLMKNLSKFRRQTGQQIKINQSDAQKLYYQYKDSHGVFQLLQNRSNFLRNQCIDDHKIQLTNSKTYTQDLQLRIYESQKQADLDRLFKRSKRSGTSHQVRQKNSRINSRNSFLHRAQTTSAQRRQVIFAQNNQQNYNRDYQDLLYEQIKTDNNRRDLEESLQKHSRIQNSTTRKNSIFNHEEAVFQDY